MKLKLTKAWYEERAKAEEKCSFVAAGASLGSSGEDLRVRKVKSQSTKRTDNKSSSVQAKGKRKDK